MKTLPLTPPIPKRGKPKSFNIRDVDAELHACFKAVCARRGRSIRGATLALIKEACRDDKPDSQNKLPYIQFRKTLERHREIK